MRQTPSDHFTSSILTAYDIASRSGKAVTPSAIWDELVIMCLRTPGGFAEMFAWDRSRAKHVNRIGTIREVIAAGLVPGLTLSTNAKGRDVVVEIPL